MEDENNQINTAKMFIWTLVPEAVSNGKLQKQGDQLGDYYFVKSICNGDKEKSLKDLCIHR